MASVKYVKDLRSEAGWDQWSLTTYYYTIDFQELVLIFVVRHQFLWPVFFPGW